MLTGVSNPCVHVHFIPFSFDVKSEITTYIPVSLAIKLYNMVDCVVQKEVSEHEVIILFSLLHDASFSYSGMEHDILQELPLTLQLVSIASFPGKKCLLHTQFYL